GLEAADTAPAETIYVGDSYFVDVVGARQAGLGAVLFDPGRTWGARDCAVATGLCAAVEHAVGEPDAHDGPVCLVFRGRVDYRRDESPAMSEVREHSAQLLRAYQAQEKRFVERRFPLEFAPEVPALRELYSQGKGLRWNPETDIAWERFDPARYDKATREAASRTWSRRAWSVYPGLTESTALLIRFCLESGSLGMDAKLFLSFRPAEEAKHLEVCHMLAERFGGYTADPEEPGLARVSNHSFGQAALDRDLPVEAYIAALGALDDQLDLNLHVSHLQQTKDEVVRAALRLIATDRARHVV